MKACILYFSQIGNTKKFAEAISESLKTSALFDISSSEPSEFNDYDVLIIGTPTHGFRPSVEALAFVEGLPEGDGRRTVLFCTCRLWKGSTFKKLEKVLKNKNYKNVLCVAVKKKDFTKEDFLKPAEKIAKVFSKLEVLFCVFMLIR
jgi:flavodoxin